MSSKVIKKSENVIVSNMFENFRPSHGKGTLAYGITGDFFILAHDTVNDVYAWQSIFHMLQGQPVDTGPVYNFAEDAIHAAMEGGHVVMYYDMTNQREVEELFEEMLEYLRD